MLIIAHPWSCHKEQDADLMHLEQFSQTTLIFSEIFVFIEVECINFLHPCEYRIKNIQHVGYICCKSYQAYPGFQAAPRKPRSDWPIFHLTFSAVPWNPLAFFIDQHRYDELERQT